MANEFKIKKGLIVTGASGGTVVDIQGSQGQLFSVTDDLSGSIFAVSDISGVPIFDVNSSGISYFDGKLGIGLTPTTVNLEVKSIQDISFDEGIGVVRSNTSQTGYINMVGGAMNINAPNAIPIKFRDGGNTNLTIGGDGHATFAGDVTIGGKTYPKISLTDNQGVARTFSVGTSNETFTVRNETASSDAFTISNANNATFAAQAFSAATSSGDASSTLTTKGYVDSLITGATIYRGTWQAGISATSTGTTSSSTTLTVSAAILDAAGNTPTLVGAVVTGAGITGTVKVASVTSSTVYELDTAISATATAYIFSPIYGAPDLSGVTQTSGYYYICSEAGSATPNGAGTEPNTWDVGDWVIWNDDVGASGEWQKVDNSSVLSGVGTGQTVAWEGAGSVTDSETLGNAPITVSATSVIFTRDIMPSAENLYDIGSASVRWEDIYADQVYGRSVYVDDNIYHNGDTDTYIAFAADRQTFLAGGDEFIDFREATESYITLGNSNDTDTRMQGGAGYIFIQGSDGYIGINDATPSYPFEVNANTYIGATLETSGNATFGGDVNTGRLFVEQSGADMIDMTRTGVGTYRFAISSSDAFSLFDVGANVDRLVIDSSGNVGIGKTPQARNVLDIQRNDTLGSFITHRNDTGFALNRTYADYGNDGNTVEYQERIGVDGNNSSIGNYSNHTLAIRTNNQNRITILSGGNVGIGTTSPGANLDVAGAAPVIRITNTTDPLGNGTVGSFEFFTNDSSTGATRTVSSIVCDNQAGSAVPGGELVFKTSLGGSGSPVATEKMRIEADGTVLIGTASSGYDTTQGYPLHAMSDLTSQSYISVARKGQTSGTEGLIVGLDTANAYVLVRDNIPLILGTNNLSHVFIQPGGNVGIGTTSPGFKFVVQDDGTDQMIADFRDSNSVYGLLLSSTGTGGKIEGRGTNHDLTINTSGTGDITLIPGGNVGIGTISPQQLLDVNTNSTGLNVDNTAAIFGNDIGTTQSRDTWVKMRASSQTTDRSWAFGTQQSGDFRFNYLGDRTITPTNAAASTLLTIKNNGNVGIGTTSPSSKLHVKGDMVTIEDPNGGYKMELSADNNPVTIRSDNRTGASYGSMAFIAGNGSDANDITRMTIDTSGNVGIGTTSPNSKLQVVGKATSTSTVSTDAATTLVTKDYVDSSAGNPSHFRQGHKSHNLTNAFTTCLTVNLSNHTSCYVTVCCFGDWGSHSAAAYRGEFFLQNGANSYNEPGIILRQDDNTSNSGDQIVCQILDPTSTANPKNFEIQIRTTATTGTTGFTGLLTFTVQGKFNSVT